MVVTFSETQEEKIEWGNTMSTVIGILSLKYLWYLKEIFTLGNLIRGSGA